MEEHGRRSLAEQSRSYSLLRRDLLPMRPGDLLHQDLLPVRPGDPTLVLGAEVCSAGI
jgi:hypothetical protein